MLSDIVNALIIIILLLTMVFLIVAILFLIWYYSNELAKQIKKKKPSKAKDKPLDKRPINEQLDEYFGWGGK